jgi:hypothetical protein
MFIVLCCPGLILRFDSFRGSCHERRVYTEACDLHHERSAKGELNFRSEHTVLVYMDRLNACEDILSGMQLDDL